MGFLPRRLVRQKTTSFFCAAGLQVKKRWPFSALQGRKSKNDGRFLRCRVASQETMAVFCAAGLHVKKRWPFSALQGCKSKNDGCFLPTEANRGKIVWFHGFLRHIFIRNRFAIRQKYLPLHSKIENFNRFNGRLSFGNLWFIGVKFSATQLISTP